MRRLLFSQRTLLVSIVFLRTTEMPLKILLSSTLREYRPDYDPLKGLEVSVDGKSTIADLCAKINIPTEKIKVFMVNGKSASLDYILVGNERVALFPPVGGG
jgi:sulfur carrier protein ThiS